MMADVSVLVFLLVENTDAGINTVLKTNRTLTMNALLHNVFFILSVLAIETV